MWLLASIYQSLSFLVARHCDSGFSEHHYMQHPIRWTTLEHDVVQTGPSHNYSPALFFLFYVSLSLLVILSLS